MPSRCSLERTDPAGRRRIFAASSTGIAVIRSTRRCCSGFVHSRYARFCFTPSSRRNRRQASRGFPEISASVVTSVLRSASRCSWLLLVRSLYCLTSSLASLGQRNIRRLGTPSASPILLPSGGWILRGSEHPRSVYRHSSVASGIPRLSLLLQKGARTGVLDHAAGGTSALLSEV